MNDMRRTLLWVVFSMSLFLLYDAWNKHIGKPSLFSPQVATQQAAKVAPVGPGASSVPTASATTPAASAGTSVPPTSAAAVQSEKTVITTDVFKLTFDSQGASLVRVELLLQPDHLDRRLNTVLLDQSPQRLYTAQSGLIGSSGGAATPNHLTPMTLQPGPRTFGPGDKELTLRYESADVGGIKLVKTYTVRRSDYVIDVKHEVVNTAAVPASPQLYMQLVRDGNAPPGESSFYFTFTGPAMYTEAKKFTKIDFSSIEKRAPGDKPAHEVAADNGWVAMVQHYFASAWLLGTSEQADREQKIKREFFSRKVDTNQYAVGMLVPLGTVAPGTTKAFDARLFVGPQEEDRLSKLATGLELVKDYGWFTILSKPLFWLLTKLHGFIGNWGWAIVGLVVLLKVAFYWLNATAYRSMAKMKAINPKITEMRERLKDKPQQMQQEMMRIYREEKVNPLGGCLPIFVQMPFFIALYWVLLSTVEMRGAPWIGWITDLSAKDPYFILPILMTLSSLLQTWLNPTPPDPMQAKMMWIMPLVFSVMFFFFPAGLVLYWLTNNILSIAQQYLINKQLGVLGK